MIDIATNIQGPLEAMAELRSAYPEAIDAAIKMEAVNIQRSVAASVRNLQVKKYRFEGLNKRGNAVYSAKKLAPLDQFGLGNRHWRRVHTPGGVLGLDTSVSIQVDSSGITIGHKPRLRDWILRWQNGVPQHPFGSTEQRRYWYSRLMPYLTALVGMHLVKGEDKLAFIRSIAPQSPERSFYDEIGEVVNRDFPVGLGKVLGKIVSGAIRKSNRAKMRK